MSAPDTFDFLQAHGTLSSDGRLITLPKDLDRPLYDAVNDLLTRIGGRWNRSRGGHAFDFDVSALYRAVLESRQLPDRNPTAYFPTPDTLVAAIIDMAGISPYSRVLEPSAGTGAIADAARAAGAELVHCCEVLDVNRHALQSKGHTLIAADFMALHTEQRYTHALLNPPFSLPGDRNTYMKHVRRAFDLLTPNGVLIAVAPTSFLTSRDRASADFLDFVLTYGGYEVNPDGSFRSSGTDVATCTLHLSNHDVSWRQQPHEGWPSWMAWYACVLIDNTRSLARQVQAMNTATLHGKTFGTLLAEVLNFARAEHHCALTLTDADQTALREHYTDERLRDHPEEARLLPDVSTGNANSGVGPAGIPSGTPAPEVRRAPDPEPVTLTETRSAPQASRTDFGPLFG